MATDPKQTEAVDTALALLEAVHRHIAAAAERVGLTVSQALFLRNLSEPISMREVAQAMQCDPSNVTGIIDRLERRGLVDRQADPADRRVRLLVLTAEGRRVRSRFERALGDGMPPFAGLGAAESDRLVRLVRSGLPSLDHSPNTRLDR